MNGELKVCYSVVNACLASLINQICIPFWKLQCVGYLWADFLQKNYDTNIDAAIVQHLKGNGLRLALNAPSYRPAHRSSSDQLVVPDSWNVPAWLVLTLSSPAAPHSSAWAAEPSHQILISSSRTGDQRSAAAALAAHSWIGSWAATTAGNLRAAAAVNKAAEGCV